MKRLLFLLLLATLGCSCKKTILIFPEELKEIRLNCAITTTKSVNNGELDDLMFLRKDSPSTTNDYSDCIAIAGSRAVSGAITFNTPQYYGTNNSFFASYYPVGSVVDNVVVWAIDGKTDIMVAPTIDAGSDASPNSTATLFYMHQLAQLEVICRAANDNGSVQTRWGKITGIKLKNTPATISLAYNGLGVTVGNDKSDIALVDAGYADNFQSLVIPASNNTTVNAAGMFAPSVATSFDLEIATENGGLKIVTVTLEGSKTFERSKKHIVTLTFQPVGADTEIAVSSSLELWSDGASGSGNVN